MEYFLIIISAIFVNNIVLAQFLGICPYLGVSSRWSSCWASRSGSSPWAWAKLRPALRASAPWLSITASCGSCGTVSGTNTFSLYNNQ